MVMMNGELLHECSPKHPRKGTARMKQDKETEDEGSKKRGVYIWKEVQRARKSSDGLNYSLGRMSSRDRYSPKQ